MKILVNTPDYKTPSAGGVASFYHGMLNYWNEDVKYNTIGTRKKISGILWMPWDIIKFVLTIVIWRPNVVLLNPSLNAKAIRRDFIYLKIAKFLKTNIVVLFHGFDLEYAKIADKRWMQAHLNDAALIMVLAEQFKNVLSSWGVTTPISLISTKVEDKMLDGYDHKSRSTTIRNILFLSRIEKAKGVYELVKAFEILHRKYDYLQLTIVGNGSELNALINYTKQEKIEGITFTGALDGQARLEAYKNADLFVFPSYGEGMPTVVLEAMAFGLPIVTRRVGGLCDFFQDEKMGYSTESFDPNEIARLAEKIIENPESGRNMSDFNYIYAEDHFLASKVGKKIESLIAEHC